MGTGKSQRHRGAEGQIRKTRALPAAAKHLTVYNVSGARSLLQAVGLPLRGAELVVTMAQPERNLRQQPGPVGVLGSGFGDWEFLHRGCG